MIEQGADNSAGEGFIDMWRTRGIGYSWRYRRTFGGLFPVTLHEFCDE
jgi:hypothetical protein